MAALESIKSLRALRRSVRSNTAQRQVNGVVVRKSSVPIPMDDKLTSRFGLVVFTLLFTLLLLTFMFFMALCTTELRSDLSPAYAVIVLYYRTVLNHTVIFHWKEEFAFAGTTRRYNTSW